MKARRLQLVLAALAVLAFALPAFAQSAAPAAKKPNILVMFGDDVGYWNVSAYNRGMMGYRRRRGRSSPTPTPSSPAPRAAPRSSPGSRRSAPD